MDATMQSKIYFAGDDKAIITPVNKNHGKYKSVPCYVDYQGKRHKTHSLGEAKRFVELLQLQAAGVISNLQWQVEVVLQARCLHTDEVVEPCKYIADFRYIKDGILITEDFKSEATARDDTFLMKQKLYNSMYPDNPLRIVTQANPH